MKINKYYLKQLILEELIKELQGPPKKPPTKIKPKSKPKPIDKSITFYYLLDDDQENSTLREYTLTPDQMKEFISTVNRSDSNRGTTEEEQFTSAARKVVNIGDVDSSRGIRYSYLKNIIDMVPELKDLTGLEYQFYGTTIGSYGDPRYEIDKYKSEFGQRTVQMPPVMQPDIGTIKTGRYDSVKRARKLTDYDPSVFLRAFWRFKIGAESEQYKQKYINSYDLDDFKRYIEHLEWERDTKYGDSPEAIKNYNDSINNYKKTLKLSKIVNDKLEIKKERYYHGFVPVSLIITGITRPSKDNPEEYEIIDTSATYFTYNDLGFDEFKKDGTSSQKTEETNKAINSLLLQQKPKTVTLKFSKNSMKTEKISKDEFVKRTSGEPPEIDKPETEPEDDKLSDFNKSLKSILGKKSDVSDDSEIPDKEK
jgi:hypothetical protein